MNRNNLISALFIICLITFLALPAPAASATPAEKGKEAFTANACIGCHVMGSALKGPDLTALTNVKSREWIIDFILNPEKHYDEPDIKELIAKYNKKMPNQEVEKGDAELIFEYLKSLAPTKPAQ